MYIYMYIIYIQQIRITDIYFCFRVEGVRLTWVSLTTLFLMILILILRMRNSGGLRST